MSLDSGIPGTDLFLGKGDREGGVGRKAGSSEGERNKFTEMKDLAVIEPK